MKQFPLIKLLPFIVLLFASWISGFKLSAQQVTFQNFFVGVPGEYVIRDFDFFQTRDSGFVMDGAQRMLKCDINGTLLWFKDNNSQSFESYAKHTTGSYVTSGVNGYDWSEEKG